MASNADGKVEYKVGNYGTEVLDVTLEPSAMSYPVPPRGWITIRVDQAKNSSPEVVYSADCVSFWFWGDIQIMDDGGVEIGSLSH